MLCYINSVITSGYLSQILEIDFVIDSYMESATACGQTYMK